MIPLICQGGGTAKREGIQKLREQERSFEGDGEVGLKGSSHRRLLKGLRNSLNKLLWHCSRGNPISQVKKRLDHGLGVHQEDMS
jgi:hypothetical protein